MKSLLTALVISAASVFPSAAGIHDFTPSNAAPAVKPSGNCYYTSDKSQVCWQREKLIYAVAIYDVDLPRQTTSVVMDCSTGRWKAFGNLPKQTLDLYMGGFCNNN